MRWKEFLLRVALVGVAVVAGAFIAVRMALALNPGTSGGATRTALTVAGTLTGVTAPVAASFTFRNGAGQSCTPPPVTITTSGTGGFNVQIDVETCPAPFFDGSDVVMDVAVDGSPIVVGAVVNPVPYARYADRAAQAGSATTAMSAVPDSGLDQRLTAGAAPPGTIVAFAGPSTRIPPGWLFCDGASVGRETYPTLFAAIGTTWGSGTGTSSFNLPDLRGRFLRGTDQGSNRDLDRVNSDAGVGTFQDDQFRLHSHTVPTGTGPDLGPSVPSVVQYYFRSAVSPITTSTTGGSETRPTNAAVTYIIRY